jgi:hypothetical protein
VRILGIHGRAGTGKSSLAAAVRSSVVSSGLVERCDIMSFASPIKAAVCTLMGDWDASETNSKKDEPLDSGSATRRDLMRLVGSWLRANARQDHWVRLMAAECYRLARYAPDRTLVIVDDVRYDNEALWIRDSGGVVVARPGGHIGDGHPSEAGIRPQLVDMWVPRWEDLVARDAHVSAVVELVGQGGWSSDAAGPVRQEGPS